MPNKVSTVVLKTSEVQAIRRENAFLKQQVDVLQRKANKLKQVQGFDQIEVWAPEYQWIQIPETVYSTFKFCFWNINFRLAKIPAVVPLTSYKSLSPLLPPPS